jgi:hypothetical protein
MLRWPEHSSFYRANKNIAHACRMIPDVRIARQGKYDSVLSLASTAFDNELWGELNKLL